MSLLHDQRVVHWTKASNPKLNEPGSPSSEVSEKKATRSMLDVTRSMMIVTPLHAASFLMLYRLPSDEILNQLHGQPTSLQGYSQTLRV